MAERIWTEEQRQAIEADGGPLLVSAAAGSGKTAVLVERAARLLFRRDNPVDADRLLIVTFTKAAAGELRGRLAARLEKEIAARPGEAALLRQRILLGRASIGTVHSFCLSLLREYYGELGLPPDFTTEDETRLKAVEQEAMDAALEQSFAADSAFAKVAALSGRARSDENAAEMVRRLVRLVRAMPYPEKQLDRLEEMYTEFAPPERTIWGSELLAEGMARAEYGLALTREALALIEQHDEMEPYRSMAQAEARAFADLEQAMEQGWDAARSTLSAWEFSRFPAAKKAPAGPKATIKALRDEWKSVWNGVLGIMPCTAQEHEEDMKAMAPLAAALIQGARRYMKELYALKLENKMLDFSDLEHLTLALLSPDGTTPTPAAGEIRSRFDAVMVDEYQDTSELQDTLFRLLAAPDGGNLFFVGDVKQSVYRFRQASPEGFLRKLNAYAPYGGGFPALVRLSKNFRSLPGVLDGVNDIFAQLMTREMGDVDYTVEEALRFGGEVGGPAGAFEFCLVQGDDAAEARYVAEAIARMLEEGTEVRGADGLRPCRPEDIAILLHAPKSQAEAFRTALEERGIASAVAREDKLLLAPAIQPVLAALRVVDNPAQDIPLAAAMLSPLFGFTEGDLIRLRADHPGGSLWAAVSAAGEETEAFLQELATLRALAAAMSADEFTRTLCRRAGYEEYCAVLPGTEDALRQLRAFYALAARYAGGGGLSGFLRMTDSILEEGLSDGGLPAAATPAGRVSIMSIHRAKGLEFPICILAGAGHGFNRRDNNGPALFHGALGIGIKLRRDTTTLVTIPWQAVNIRRRREGDSEELRVLYVALTRGRDRVLVTGRVDDTEKYLSGLAAVNVGEKGPLPYLLRKKSSFLDWLCLALLRHPAGGALQVAAGATASPRRGVAALTVDIVRDGATPPLPEKPAPVLPEPDQALTARLLTLFEAQSPRGILARVPAKMAVTALAHPEESDLLPRPSFMYAAGLSAAERGTALHAFLQYADYAAARVDIQKEVGRLVAGRYMLADVAAALPVHELTAFLHSGLCDEICAAQTVLREYSFITAVPAARVHPDLPSELAEEQVLLQGIADCLYINGDTATLVDYKSDRVKTPEELARRYRAQLLIYREALAPRLGVPIGRCVLYSFHLGVPVEVF